MDDPSANFSSPKGQQYRKPHPAVLTDRFPQSMVWTVAFYFCSLTIAAGAALLLRGTHPGSLESLANFMGPLAENLAHGRGYIVCGAGMSAAGNVLCFHANRMPLPPALLALLIRLFDNRYLPVELAKIALVLLPAASAFGLAISRSPQSPARNLRFPAFALLLFGLILPIQLIDVINMQVEEGYSFCLLSYAMAVLVFGVQGRWISWPRTLYFALSVVALYLTKSSMIVCVAFLVLAFWLQVDSRRKRAAVLLLALCGPIGWGIYTIRTTGRFAVGTSLDGINLHKGNYAEFLDRYPPPPGGGLDQYDESLNLGRSFSNEWAFNAYHTHAAEVYILGHPTNTLRATLRKSEVFFFSLQKIGSEHYTGWLGNITEASMALFRLLLWSACGLGIYTLIQDHAHARWPAIVYLGTVLTVAAPYLAGFALTRHASVLSFPSALFLCWRLGWRAKKRTCSDCSSFLYAAPAPIQSSDR